MTLATPTTGNQDQCPLLFLTQPWEVHYRWHLKVVMSFLRGDLTPTTRSLKRPATVETLTPPY